MARLWTKVLTQFFYLLLSLLFFRQLLSDLAERNSTKTGHMRGNECDLKMRVRNLEYTLPSTNQGPQNQLFRGFRNLAATLTPISSKRNTIYITAGKCCKLQGVSYVISKRLKFWSTNCLKLDLYFTRPPQILHFASLSGFANGDQQTELNQSLSNGGRQIALTTCRLERSESSLPKIGGQKRLHLFGFFENLETSWWIYSGRNRKTIFRPLSVSGDRVPSLRAVYGCMCEL